MKIWGAPGQAWLNDRVFNGWSTEVCEGRVGAVFCLEASRLARNGRDWHHLIELCGLRRRGAHRSGGRL